MIRFTIITVTFDAEAVFERTANSVLMQTYPHVEHVIIDGASRDRTIEMAHTYKVKSDEAKTGHTVTIFSEPDNGLYDAMNKGLFKASGDYICYLNAGDTLPSADTLDLIASSVGDGEALPGVLYGDTDVVDRKGVSCIIADWLHPNNSHGDHSDKGCWCAIKLFMLAPTLQETIPMTCVIICRPM